MLFVVWLWITITSLCPSVSWTVVQTVGPLVEIFENVRKSFKIGFLNDRVTILCQQCLFSYDELLKLMKKTQ